MEATEKLEQFKEMLVSEFPERIKCILLTGSYSRGEQTERSDIDLWVFFDNITFEDCSRVGQLLTSLPKEPRMTPKCTSFEECLFPYFIKEYSPIQYSTDGIVLYGDLKLPHPSKEEILEQALKMYTFTLMGVRHFLSVGEEEKDLLKRRLFRRVLKPFIWSTRYKYLYTNQNYKKNIIDLKGYCDEDEQNIISVYMNFLAGNNDKYIGHSKELMEKIYNICERSIDMLYLK